MSTLPPKPAIFFDRDGTLFEDICLHTRDQGCECIKPKPYFVLKASQEFNLDLSRSFVVGDHPHDMELSQQVGAPLGFTFWQAMDENTLKK